jgi:serine/threonine-protein kinase RsbW
MAASLRITAELKNLEMVRHFVQEQISALQIDSDGVYDVLLAVTEAMTNIIAHGYQGKSGGIEVEVSREGNSLLVRLRDQARPFDPTLAPAPDMALPLERRPFGKMGIHLMRRVMDKMVYRAIPEGGNELTLVKYLPAPDNPQGGTA